MSCSTLVLVEGLPKGETLNLELCYVKATFAYGFSLLYLFVQMYDTRVLPSRTLLMLTVKQIGNP